MVQQNPESLGIRRMRYGTCFLIASYIVLLLCSPVRAQEPLLGFYCAPDKTHIDAVVNSPFKYLIPYGTDGKEEVFLTDYLQYAAKNHLNIIFSVKDAYRSSKWYPKIKWCGTDDPTLLVECISKRFGKHAGLYGWYLADEPTSYAGTDDERRLRRNADAIRLHSAAPIFVEDFDLTRAKLWSYLSEFTDVLMTGIYPVPERKVIDVYEVISGLVERYRKPLVAVIQAHGKYQYPAYKRDLVTGRAPTLGEMKVMSYLALLAGAKGIVYYSLFDLKKLPDFEQRFEFLKNLGRELERDFPIISSSDVPKTLIKAQELPGVFQTSRRHKGRDYIVVVNTKAESIRGYSPYIDGKKQSVNLGPYDVKVINLSIN